jgi:mRNA interferase RelE/StbE
MEYRVLILPRAQRQIESLPRQTRTRIIGAIDTLEKNPRSLGTKKLKGTEDLYRLRVGDYRIIYAIQDDELLVIVVNAGHRKDIYRGLS